MEELAEEEEAVKAKNNWHELPEPKNLEFLKKMSVPLRKTEKFEEIEKKELETARAAAKQRKQVLASEPTNMEHILRLSAPLPKNVSKKFSSILDEENKQREAEERKLKEKIREMKKQKAKLAASMPQVNTATGNLNNSAALASSSESQGKGKTEESKEEHAGQPLEAAQLT
jgi:hypothetical protein